MPLADDEHQSGLIGICAYILPNFIVLEPHLPLLGFAVPHKVVAPFGEDVIPQQLCRRVILRHEGLHHFYEAGLGDRCTRCDGCYALVACLNVMH